MSTSHFIEFMREKGIEPTESDIHKFDAMARSHCESDSCSQVAELKALIKEASDYLDTNEFTSIGSSSILHNKFKEALSQ